MPSLRRIREVGDPERNVGECNEREHEAARDIRSGEAQLPRSRE